jgi:signal transduction histidine kinase
MSCAHSLLSVGAGQGSGAGHAYTQPFHMAATRFPVQAPLSRAVGLVRRVIDEGRAALRGVHMTSTPRSGLEQAFYNFLEQAGPGRGVRLRVFVQGKPRTVNPATHEQLFLIGREAVMNALRHSQATEIEVEVQYLRALLRVIIRDDGCGICTEARQNAGDGLRGLRGMRDRAESIGAQFGISTERGAGTEVHVAIPIHVAMASGEP